MTRLVVLALLVIVAGCAVSENRTRVTMQSLRDYRAARMAEDASMRIAVTWRDPRVRELRKPRREHTGADTALLRELRAQGRHLAAQFGLRLVDDYPLPALGLHAYVLEGGDEERLDAVIAVLTQDPNVEDVRRMSLYRTQGAAPAANADDPLAPLQALPAQELRELHTLATGKNVTVVIIDTGIDTGHEDLRGARLAVRDLVNDRDTVPPEAHATAIGGLILAQPRNGVGIRGFAPDSRVIALRACWQPYETEAAFCNTSTLAKALSAALEASPDIVNLSLTGPMDPLLAQLVAELQAQNVIVVAANADQRDQGAFPSALPGVIAATGRPLRARDPGPVYAPGRDIISLMPDNRYGLQDGSSIAAAQVSGIASLFRERNPAITSAELAAILHGRGTGQEGMPGLLDALRAAAD